VDDINSYLSVGDTVRVKVRSIEGDRIDLSIKEALDPVEGEPKPEGQAPPKRRRRVDSDFEAKMKKYLKDSEQKLADARRQKEARGKHKKRR
jgi:S1 RNA binding domain protein